MTITPLMTPHRRGVALVIALIVLAGLLLLGLPFLFSQSTSLAGSRSFAYHQSATTGREAAEQFATAAVAGAEADHLRATAVPGSGSDRVSLTDNLTATGIVSDLLTRNQLALVTPTATAGAAHTGVLISCALQARSGARNRAGQATLKLAQALASVTGKAVRTGGELKKQVDSIHGMLNNLMPVASAIAAVVAGVKGVLN